MCCVCESDRRRLAMFVVVFLVCGDLVGGVACIVVSYYFFLYRCN